MSDRRSIRGVALAVLAALALALVATVLLLALWGDAALDPAAREALHVPPRLDRARNAFNPMTGFTAARDVDPAVAGHDAVTRVNEVLRSHGGDGRGAAVRAAWITSTLELEDPDELLCSAKETGCTARLVARADALDALAVTNAVLLERYEGLARYPEYRMEVQPSPDMPFPEYQALLATHRLWLGLRAAEVTRGGAHALDALLADRQVLRRLLAQADNLLAKMVLATMLAESLLVEGALLDLADPQLDGFRTTERLDAAELSLDAALAGEFRFSASTIYALEGDPALRQDLGLPPWVGSRLMRPLFKPGRSLNAAHRCWRETRTRALGHPRRLLERRQGERGCAVGWQEWVLNPVGTILLRIAAPGFDQYAARLHDLDGLIVLLDLKRTMRESGADDPTALLEGARFVDPYRGEPMRWNAAESMLWFESAAPHVGLNRLPVPGTGG